MVCGDSPAQNIFSTSPFSAALPTSARDKSPRFGNTHLFNECCHPEIVAGLTGLRRLVETA